MNYLKEHFEESSAKSISDRVVDAVRASIINKFYASGERLVEAKVAMDLGVSVTPVRQALAQLAKEGLIDVYPYKGTYVKLLTRKFITEATYVRTALELQAAEQAYDHITRQDLRKLVEYANILEYSISQTTSLYEISRTDTLFHDVIFERSGNELLLELWNLIKPRIQLISSDNKIHISGSVRKQRHMLLVNDLRSREKARFLENLRTHCLMLIEDHSEADGSA